MNNINNIHPPNQVEAQAITTSKWDTLDPVAPEPPSFSMAPDYGSDAAGAATDDPASKRSRLREIELKIVQYQDELESGERSLKPGWTIGQQTEHYRRKLMRKDTTSGPDASDSPLSSQTRRSADYGKRSASPTPSSSSSSVVRKASASKRAKRSPSPYAAAVPSSKRRSRSPHAKRYGRDSASPPSKSSRFVQTSDSSKYYMQLIACVSVLLFSQIEARSVPITKFR